MRHLIGRLPLRRVLFSLFALALLGASCSGSDTAVEVADSGAAASSAADDASADDSGSADDAGADSDDASADSDDGDSDSDSDADSDSESDSDDGELAEGESPLAEFFGWGGGADFDEDDFVEQERQIERSVQECMQQQGFEYNPRDVSDTTFFGGGSWPGEGLSEEEYAAQYGFGMSTTFDDDMFGPPVGDMDEYVDPNGELMEAMSDGERDAWQLALYGEQPDYDEETGMPIDPETGEPSEDFFFGGPQGCYGDAQADVYGDFEVMMELDDEFQELYDRIEADPRIAEISAKWSACMAEAGYSFENQNEMYESFFEDFNELQNEVFSSFSGPGPDIDFEELEQMSDAELEALYAPPELTPEQEARLAVIQEDEIKLAVANVNCDQGALDVRMAVSAEYELQFIEENRAMLEGARGGN